jgi:hypothetical protein
VSQTQPRLREATFDDYEQIIALESSRRLRYRSCEDWRHLWLENPLYQRLGADWPIGWVLEDQDRRIVGTIGNVPVPYVFRGRNLIVAAGRAWAVDDRYRTFALMLMDQYFGQSSVDLFLNTTVNDQAAEAFGVFGSSPVPAGDWRSASYWITGYPGFARTALAMKRLPPVLRYPAALSLYFKDAVSAKQLPVARRDIKVESASRFDHRFDDFWEKLSARSQIFLGVRTREVMDWHFGSFLRRGELWLLTIRDCNRIGAYGVFQRRDEPRTGLKRMRMVDFQALAEPAGCLAAIFRYALKLARQTGIHVVEKVGRNVEDTSLLDAFAPYRRKLATWPFYFQASDPEFHQALQSPALWRPSSFDGDASL